jgi:nitric oxide reductase subunit B
MSTSAAMWSMVSIILLLAGIAAMLWLQKRDPHEDEAEVPAPIRCSAPRATPSMKATRKYFFVVIGLMLLQIAMGAITAHYAVEGQSFFGVPLAQVLPTSSAARSTRRSASSGSPPPGWRPASTSRRSSPDASRSCRSSASTRSFWALIVVVLGSTITGWLGTLQHRGVDFSFWLGNQGLEFTSMGRVWQMLLFVGLLFWVFLLGRAAVAGAEEASETRGLIAMVFLSATCIGGFYATSLTWGQHTHYSMIEYWRWWLVHLWVEGFFEVFATAVVALIFTNSGLIRAASANRAIVAETIVFLFGGILGTLHHLYWTGTPTSVIAVGAVFSALEVVPLTLIGLEALQTYRRSRDVAWLGATGGSSCRSSPSASGTRSARAARLRDQSAGVAVLRAGPQHDGRARPRRAVRRVRMLGIGLMLFCLRGLFDRSLHADRFLGPRSGASTSGWR